MRQKIQLFIIAISLAISTGTAFSQVVTSIEDSGAGTLRQVIADASNGATITFDNSLAGETITLNSRITIDKAITIEGSGQKLVPSGQNYGAFLLNGGSGVVIERLWFDGFADGNGGAIFTNGTLFTIKSCIFTNNGHRSGGVSDHGGAIASMWNGNNGTVLGCTFINNAANVAGRAVFTHSGIATAIGNVFYDNKGSADNVISGAGSIQPEGATYNVIDGNGTLPNNDATVVTISANPFTEDYAPATDDIKILPSTLPEGYPEFDFYGNAIEGGGYAGAAQSGLGDPVAVTGITLNPTTASIERGLTTAKLSTVFEPLNATNRTVTWESGDETIATVDNKGVVSGVSAGQATITATTADGGFTASATITVIEPAACKFKYDAVSESWGIAAKGGNHSWDPEFGYGYPSAVFDGSIGTGWHQSLGASQLYLVIDMKAQKEVGSVILRQFNDGHSDDFKDIQIYLTDNELSLTELPDAIPASEWGEAKASVTGLNLSSLPIAEQFVTLDLGQTSAGRYMVIYFPEKGSAYLAVGEVEVYPACEPPIAPEYFEDFENGLGKFTAVNSTTEQWFAGTGTGLTSFEGSSSAYISDDGGTSWHYGDDTKYPGNISHIYADIDAPVGTGYSKLSFQYNGKGESTDWDALRVYVTETSVTPEANKFLVNQQDQSGTANDKSIKLGTYADAANWTSASGLIIPAEKQRLVFTWWGDGGGGAIDNTPTAVDAIIIEAGEEGYYLLNISSGVTITAGTPNTDDAYTGEITVEATVPEGTALTKWIVNGTDVEPDGNEYTFTISANTTIKAVIEVTPIDVATEEEFNDAIEHFTTIGVEGVINVKADIELAGSLVLTSSIIINGEGHKLTPSEEGYPALSVGTGEENATIIDGNITVERLHIDGFTNEWGGAFSSKHQGNGIYTFKSCIFTNNSGGDGGGGAICRVWSAEGKQGGNIYVYGCTFIGNSQGENHGTSIFNHTGAVTGTGNVFFGDIDGRTDFYINGNGTPLTYNAYDRVLAKDYTPDETNVSLDESPLDENYRPATDGIKILPETLPEGYPAVDFYGTAIAGGGYAGAAQPELIVITSWEIGAPTLSDITATLDLETGIVAIAGTGATRDFPISYGGVHVGGGAPWIGEIGGVEDGTVDNATSWTPYPNAASVTGVSISEGITKIGNAAFWSNGSAYVTGTLTLPSTLTSIGTRAFSAHKFTGEITVPEGVTIIGGYAFEQSSGGNVTKVSLPSTLTTIGGHALNISTLTDLYITAGTPPETTETTFAEIDKATCVLYVPFGTKELYETADNWKEFQNITELQSIDNVDASKIVKSIEYYDLLGRPTVATAKGILLQKITYENGTSEFKKIFVYQK
ncbi:MAG: Ig-like domain-containing protein [Dysgonamonadaceae bacterium]|jgi:hypothetical protein|nr:Ig-like domain-containing protein [Dysgonamonadaceae bacterium]